VAQGTAAKVFPDQTKRAERLANVAQQGRAVRSQGQRRRRHKRDAVRSRVIHAASRRTI
jgi:hypothetical protein